MKKEPYTNRELLNLKPLKWVIEFTIDPAWVADGFDLTEDRALEMLANDLQFAYSNELGAKILKSPSAKHIKRIQGYKV